MEKLDYQKIEQGSWTEAQTIPSVFTAETTNDTLSVMLAGTQKKTQGEDELSTKGRKKRKLQNTGQYTALCVSRLWHLIKEGNKILL